MKALLGYLGILLLTFWSMHSSASLISSLYGDQDGFGVGTPIVDGGTYTGGFDDNRNPNDLADAPITDLFGQGYADASWSHSYLLDGTALSAQLELYIAGFADLGIVKLISDNVELAEFDFRPANLTTHLLQVDIPLSLITGATGFSLQGSSFDGWIFDYALLRIRTDTGTVPGPATLSLFLLALSALAYRRRVSDP